MVGPAPGAAFVAARAVRGAAPRLGPLPLIAEQPRRILRSRVHPKDTHWHFSYPSPAWSVTQIVLVVVAAVALVLDIVTFPIRLLL